MNAKGTMINGCAVDGRVLFPIHFLRSVDLTCRTLPTSENASVFVQ